MQHATITILDKECRALIFEGRTYVQPQFTGEVIGVVVRCTPTEAGWDLLLLQEEFHMVGVWITVEREDIEYFGLDEPDEMDALNFKILYQKGMERKAVPYVVVEVDYADDFYDDRHMAADYCPLL